MKFNEKYNVAPEFENLFSFKSKKEEIEHEAKMIMFRFFSELEKINSENPIKKKELAQTLKTSASYITQLYQGDKLINLLTLAKIQEALSANPNILKDPAPSIYFSELEAKAGKLNVNCWVKTSDYVPVHRELNTKFFQWLEPIED